MSSSAGLPIVQMKRIESFSAAHRLHNPNLSSEKNVEIFGKCNNLKGHGHNYRVEVVLKGPVHPESGMVYDLVDLKRCIQNVMDQLDHKHLDEDVPYFKNVISTTENVTIFIWNEVQKNLEQPQLLYEVTVHETEKNVFTFRGETSS
uniref:6-pyruvoyl tetrahydrobiopterin synthase n=1 Tax=Plectus sambesii TaxID=2011161 RepID=A0A914X7Y6_9BILA